MAAKSKQRKPRDRAVFQAASEELRAISSALAAEMIGWPGVTSRAMFGGILLYRDKLPFALLPRTRKMMEKDGLWLKFHSISPALRRQLDAEIRIVDPVTPHTTKDASGPRWVGLVVGGTDDVHLALRWLGEAYTAARRR
jgi:hypothetical protein